jgi:Fe-S-cluster containining protein
MDFPCIKCGLCCKTLKNIPILSEYDNGNGVCRYLANNLCSIYDSRPLVCNVEAMYSKYFAPDMTEREFIIANLEACQKIADMFHDNAALQKIKKMLSRGK